MRPVHADIFAPVALEGGPSERQHLLGVGHEDSNWGEGLIKYLVVLVENPQPCLDPPTSEWHDGQRWLLSWESALVQRACARLDESKSCVCDVYRRCIYRVCR